MAATTVRSGYLLNKGNPLNYLEWGSPEAPAVVLIHGLRGFAYSWRPTAERLSDRYRCIALNLRGHGDSGPSPEREYNFELYASDVHALFEARNLARFTIIGHSLGGRVAIAYAAAYPERTQAIVVVDIAPGMPEEAAWALKRTMEATPPAFDSWEGALAFAHGGRPSLPVALMEERAPYVLRRLPDGKVTWKHDPLVREEWLGPDLPPRGRVHLWGEMERVQCPMLVVKGEVTNQLDADLCDRMVRYGPNSRWVEIPKTTHFVHDDNLEGFLSEVEPFLAQVATVAVR